MLVVLFIPKSSRLERYLESGGRDATVKPWVWISLLFVSPVAVSLSSVRYMSGIVRQCFYVISMFLQSDWWWIPVIAEDSRATQGNHDRGYLRSRLENAIDSARG